MDPAGLKDEAWKATAGTLLQKLTNNGNSSAWDAYRELIVIPDGPLWYVPFEALQVPGAAGSQPLISKVRVRYLPTAGLLTMGGSSPKPHARTLVVTGPMVPGQDKQVTATACEAIQRALEGVTRCDDRLAAPSGLVSTLCDRLIVLSDLEPSPRVRTAGLRCRWIVARLGGRWTPGSRCRGKGRWTWCCRAFTRGQRPV